MRRITGSLAALLSVLMVSTSASASICDLSCWLHQAHSDCRTVSSGTKAPETAMSMSSAMDMNPDESESMMGPKMGAGATPDDSTSTSSDMEMGPDHSDGMKTVDMGMNAALGHSISPPLAVATEHLKRATKPEMGTSTMHDHSTGVTSCTHETCSQSSASASPPQKDHHQASSIWKTMSSSSHDGFWIGFHWVRLGTPPPEVLATDGLTTALRI